MGSGKDGAGECCARAIVIIVNILVGLIGFVLLAAGIFILVGQPVYESFSEAIVEAIPSITDSLDLVANKNTDNNSLDLAGLLQTVAIALIVFGGVLFILAIMGCCGACCSVKCIMAIYTTFLILILIAQVVLVGLFFGKVLNEPLKNQLNNTLVEKYAGIDCFEAECLVFNYVMMEVECCGLDNYNDFKYVKNWESERTFTKDGNNVTKTLATPIACCKFNGTFPEVKPASNECFEDTLSEVDSNFNKGCWEKVSEELDEYYWTAVGVAAGILVVQLILCLLAIYITVQVMRDDKGSVV